MSTFDQNRPAVRAKGFQKPASEPPVSKQVPPVPVAAPIRVEFAPPAVVALPAVVASPDVIESSPIPEDSAPLDALAPLEEDGPFDDSPVTFVEPENFMPSDTLVAAQTPHAHSQPDGVRTPGNYQSDPDPTRVSRRQWWKHNLYVRSGREAADNPQ